VAYVSLVSLGSERYQKYLKIVEGESEIMDVHGLLVGIFLFCSFLIGGFCDQEGTFCSFCVMFCGWKFCSCEACFLLEL
jgi:hypothetical protein